MDEAFSFINPNGAGCMDAYYNVYDYGFVGGPVIWEGGMMTWAGSPFGGHHNEEGSPHYFINKHKMGDGSTPYVAELADTMLHEGFHHMGYSDEEIDGFIDECKIPH